jgi:hypothetical protein
MPRSLGRREEDAHAGRGREELGRPAPGTEAGRRSFSLYDTVSGIAGIWPRISPFGFLGVWTFTYARPDSSAARTEPLTEARPRAPLRHGPHSPTATPPAAPRRPRWMCAATARPVSLLKVSRHVITALVPDFVAVTVNEPRARLALPFGLGTSWREFIAARTVATAATWPRISPAEFVGVWTLT